MPLSADRSHDQRTLPYPSFEAGGVSSFASVLKFTSPMWLHTTRQILHSLPIRSIPVIHSRLTSMAMSESTPPRSNLDLVNEADESVHGLTLELHL